MYYELSESYLDVQLVPCQRDGDKNIRAVCNKNPSWYIELCKRYTNNRTKPRNRKSKFHDTGIKRYSVVRVLNVLANKGSSVSWYAPVLIEIAKDKHERMEDLLKDEINKMEEAPF